MGDGNEAITIYLRCNGQAAQSKTFSENRGSYLSLNQVFDNLRAHIVKAANHPDQIKQITKYQSEGGEKELAFLSVTKIDRSKMSFIKESRLMTDPFAFDLFHTFELLLRDWNVVKK